MRRTITSLQKAFLLRSCTASFYASRTRPCLLHQIKRCAAPCTREIAIADYQRLVDEAQQFLSGKSKSVQAHLSAEMNEAAQSLDFERAALARDAINVVESADQAFFAGWPPELVQALRAGPLTAR